jgi:protein transport protein SEC31
VSETNTKIPYKLTTSGTDGLICEALLTGNVSAAVELCMNAGRSTDAIILASLGGSELLARTQYRYLKNNDSFISNLISAMVMADWSGVISQCTIDSWKEALVAALTHSKEQMPLLCERLGERMQIEASGDSSLLQNSILCYICAGNIERIVDAWSAINGQNSLEDSEKLQELVEIVILLNKGMEQQGKNVGVYGKYAELLSKYASLLAAQGSLEMALTYIGTSQDDPHIVELRDRLSYALGYKHQPQKQVVNSAYQNPYQTGPRLSHPRTVSTSSTGMPPVFNTGLPSSGMANHFDQMWNQPQQQMPPPPISTTNNATMFKPPNAPELTQPPRPPSNSSVSSQPPIASSMPKPKRLLDPSVSSNPYGQVPVAAPFNPSNMGFNNNPIQPAFNNNPIQPSFNSQQPTMMTAPAPQAIWEQPQATNYNFQQSNPMTNMTMNGSMPPPPPMSVQRNPQSPPGWNDPPEASFKPKNQVRDEFFCLKYNYINL